MSFSGKLLQSCGRLWYGFNSARRFHLLMQPLTTPSIAGHISNQKPIVSSTISNILSPLNIFVQQVAGFKVKGRLKRRCKDCYIVVRQERGYVICPTHPRHKQMSMKRRDYKSWILTHATQSKERDF